MKIIEIKVLKGPNYWSVRRHKLIQLKLDLEEMEQRPTNAIPGFRKRMEQLMPSLYEHRCSEGTAGGFFKRVEEGTWMGHVIEHMALELQTLAGMDTGFGRTRGTGNAGEYFVVFSYMEEDAGVYAAKASVRIAQALIDGKDYDLAEDIQNMRVIRNMILPKTYKNFGRSAKTRGSAPLLVVSLMKQPNAVFHLSGSTNIASYNWVMVCTRKGSVPLLLLPLPISPWILPAIKKKQKPCWVQQKFPFRKAM
jgi:hypothetical protein